MSHRVQETRPVTYRILSDPERVREGKREGIEKRTGKARNEGTRTARNVGNGHFTKDRYFKT